MNFDFDLDLYALLTTDFGDVWERVGEAILDPTADLQLAILVYAIASLLVTVILVAVIVFLMSAEDTEEGGSDSSGESHVMTAPTRSPQRVRVDHRSPVQRAVSTGAITLGVCLLVWLALGAGTASDLSCEGCHAETVHTVLASTDSTATQDPHESVSCVGCHEPGSVVGRYGAATIARSAHYLYGFELADRGEYGIVTTRSCLNCHPEIPRETIENDTRGIRVSHVEVLDAGATCVDCHSLREGVVRSDIGGMTRCIRCHDGTQASAECDYCHFKDISAAASGSRPGGTDAARALIGTPDCGGCHDLVTSCDPCHGGVRLPHSEEFIRGGHARQAVESYWYGDGKACVQCHTTTRRSCGSCHLGSFWSHPKSRSVEHQGADPNNNGCVACHYGTAGTLPGRNFCIDLCHTDREDWRK
ncbi:MAG: cytochrome c3 family protein [Coriobacteriia bacterium]|nr:cytochrome c3 family protein [Coriobacteriia bacterium]